MLKSSISTYLVFLIMALCSVIPVVFKQYEISETVTMCVLAIMGGIGVSFDIVNFQHTKLKIENEPEAK